ncbi:hypothetical protein [Rubripirellula reticaptiva]|uniref:Uncharacterized protein n=1 Tax=Rubripirellula reticaptiva TaxID=2528013 RepID=A0A5C6F415_9BACT|nr:hypothetical protein [Rubripirellula reticaptiva]TWU56108.1 hypothetical protein Poly59_24120 [Rubripirellula reticaptiva]
MEAIDGLENDWSQIVDEEGNQIGTVGHHFKLSRAFNKEEMDHIKRDGTCIACHKEIPKASLAVSLLHHVAEYSGQLPKTTNQHFGLVNKIVLTSAWGQVLLALGGMLVGALVVGGFGYRKWKPKSQP